MQYTVPTALASSHTVPFAQVAPSVQPSFPLPKYASFLQSHREALNPLQFLNHLIALLLGITRCSSVHMKSDLASSECSESPSMLGVSEPSTSGFSISSSRLLLPSPGVCLLQASSCVRLTGVVLVYLCAYMRAQCPHAYVYVHVCVQAHMCTACMHVYTHVYIRRQLRY